MDSSTKLVLRFNEIPAVEQKFEGRSTRQRREGPLTTRRSSIANRILRTLHAPAPRGAENNEKVVHCEQKSEDAPRASAARGRKPREGRRSRTEFSGCSTRQRREGPKTTRGSSIANRSPRMLHAPARGSSIANRILRTLHAPALQTAENHERVVTFANSQNALHASAGARRKQRDGSQFASKIRTAPQRERFDAHETRRGFAGDETDSHGASTGAIRRVRSLQRVRCSCGNFAGHHSGSPVQVRHFARRHNGSDATRTKPAESALRRFPMTLPRL